VSWSNTISTQYASTERAAPDAWRVGERWCEADPSVCCVGGELSGRIAGRMDRICTVDKEGSHSNEDDYHLDRTADTLGHIMGYALREVGGCDSEND
jgi:hypothetical protein